jgi:hypothetical protein
LTPQYYLSIILKQKKEMNETYYKARLLQGKDELEAFFKLRYRLFHQSYLGTFLEKNEYGIDIDPMDMQAYHLGLFEITDGVEKPIGYNKIEVESFTHYEASVKALLGTYPNFDKKRFEKEVQPINLHNFSLSEDFFNLYIHADRHNEVIAKSSRLCIDESVPNRKMLSKLFCRTVFVDAVPTLANHLLFEMSEHHYFIMAETGVKPLNTQFNTAVEHNVLLLYLNDHNIQPSFKEKLDEMQSVYQSLGYICLYPQDEENFYPPQYSLSKLKQHA